MSAAEPFFDTNVLLYLLSAETAKADRAEALLADGGVISVQVLDEFTNVARRRFDAPWEVVRETLETLRAILRVEPLTIETHAAALEIAERHNLSIYDASILAAAQGAGCGFVYSEDMQDGFRLASGPSIRNPFVGA